MITLVPSGLPPEMASAYTLLEIIADPAKARKHLDAIKDEKQAALDAQAKAASDLADANSAVANATATFAAAKKLTDDFNANHEVRTKSLDERHNTLVATNKRLTEFEAQVSAREKEVGATLDQREASVKEREADITKREAELRILEEATQQLKEAYQKKVDAFREMQEALK
jgi:chromosome segregation ATPase